MASRPKVAESVSALRGTESFRRRAKTLSVNLCKETIVFFLIGARVMSSECTYSLSATDCRFLQTSVIIKKWSGFLWQEQHFFSTRWQLASQFVGCRADETRSRKWDVRMVESNIERGLLWRPGSPPKGGGRRHWGWGRARPAGGDLLEQTVAKLEMCSADVVELEAGGGWSD